jgi:hypothetical protein
VGISRGIGNHQVQDAGPLLQRFPPLLLDLGQKGADEQNHTRLKVAQVSVPARVFQIRGAHRPFTDRVQS